MATDQTNEGSVNHAVDPILARHGGLTYLEIPTTDINQSATFYANVFGWTSCDEGSDPARFSDPTGHLIGRFIANRTAAQRPGLLPYIYVNEIDDAVQRVVENRGEVITPPRPEGKLRVAVVRDPAGNVIGLWQAAES